MRRSPVGTQAVSLVGWAWADLRPRDGKLHPQLTRCVVTLGTPFTGHPKATNAWRLYELLSGDRLGDAKLMAHIRRPPPVPTTSIYSRSDGVVSWRCSLNEPTALADNIEVRSSHLGMGMNPLALYAVADRLAQPPGRGAVDLPERPLVLPHRCPVRRRLSGCGPANGLLLEVEGRSPSGEPLPIMGLGMRCSVGPTNSGPLVERGFASPLRQPRHR